MKKKSAAALAALLLISSCAEVSENRTAPAAAVSAAPEAAETEISSEAPETSTVSKAETEAETESEAESETETQEPEELPEEPGSAVIAFAGDVTQSDVFGDITDYCGLSYCLRDVAGIFSAADIAFVNLETCVSERGTSEKKAGYGFRTAPDKLEVFTSAGIDIVSVANNHVRDFGMDALHDTFENLEKYGLDYVGAGENLAEAERLSVFEVNGLKIGFTACNCFIENDNWFAEENKAGINCVYIGEESAQAYLERIKEYDELCDVLFVSVHWGIEYFHGAAYEQQTFAHQLCDNGADIILGHHPHVLEPIESYNGSVIFYSLGNFLFYKMDDDAGKTAIFTVEVDKNGFVSGKMQPVFIEDRKSYLLGGGEMYNEIIDLVNSMSEGFGAHISKSGDIIIPGISGSETADG